MTTSNPPPSGVDQLAELQAKINALQQSTTTTTSTKVEYVPPAPTTIITPQSGSVIATSSPPDWLMETCKSATETLYG